MKVTGFLKLAKVCKIHFFNSQKEYYELLQLNADSRN